MVSLGGNKVVGNRGGNKTFQCIFLCHFDFWIIYHLFRKRYVNKRTYLSDKMLNLLRLRSGFNDSREVLQHVHPGASPLPACRSPQPTWPGAGNSTGEFRAGMFHTCFHRSGSFQNRKRTSSQHEVHHIIFPTADFIFLPRGSVVWWLSYLRMLISSSFSPLRCLIVFGWWESNTLSQTSSLQNCKKIKFVV